MGLLNSNSLNEWLTGIPERAREAYRGLLNTPSEVKQLFDPQFQQGLLKNATPVSREDIINQGLNISGMAPYGMAGHIVYHGSPHKFNKFDMSKIGTGEGAQAYGHGLYFAESPEVARSYRDNLTSGLNVQSYNTESPVKYASRLVKQWGSPEQAINILTNGGERMPTGRRLEFLNAIKDGSYKNVIDELPQGQLYKVDLPDDQIAKMLDWDKPLSQQPEAVRKAIERISPKNRSGQSLVSLDASGEELIRALGGGEGASNLLREAGIPGIRYLDQGSRTAGEGTYNYVLFDDQLPRILEINGQPTGLLSWADEAKKVKKKK